MPAQIISITELDEAKRKEQKLIEQHRMLDAQTHRVFMNLLRQRKIVNRLARGEN